MYMHVKKAQRSNPGTTANESLFRLIVFQKSPLSVFSSSSLQAINQGLFGSRPNLATPHAPLPQNSEMGVAVATPATGYGAPQFGVAKCGGRPNSP
jgi:hypothetical protein